MKTAAVEAGDEGDPLRGRHNSGRRARLIGLTAEDGLSDTVAPRLKAAGADMSKVHFLTGTRAEGGDEELFDLTRDVEALPNAEHAPWKRVSTAYHTRKLVRPDGGN
jgi:hypothetical protein